MKSILVGAVETTRIAMEALASKGVPPAAVFTLPPAKASRHSDYVDLAPVAAKLEIPVVPMANVNDSEVLDKIRFIQPDYSFVIGWSQICRAEFLGLAKVGSIGYHPAPIPENRGRAVIPWTILQGRSHTGSTLFWMDEGADSGDILCQDMFDMATDETATTLYQKHCDRLHKMMLNTIDALKVKQGARVPQDHSQATYCAKRSLSDGLVDWSRPAQDIWTLIRAATKPYPGAFTFYKGQKLTLWAADFIGDEPFWGLAGQIQQIGPNGVTVQCGDGQHILLKNVQLEGQPEAAPESVLKQHDKLGIDLSSLIQSTALKT